MSALDEIVAGLISVSFRVELFSSFAEAFNICFAEYGTFRIQGVGVFRIHRDAFSVLLTRPELKLGGIVNNARDLKADLGREEFHTFFCMQEEVAGRVQLNPVSPVFPPSERIRNRDLDKQFPSLSQQPVELFKRFQRLGHVLK